jgi:hypothetical protein
MSPGGRVADALDVYADGDMKSRVFTMPLAKCRVEREVVRDGRLQKVYTSSTHSMKSRGFTIRDRLLETDACIRYILVAHQHSAIGPYEAATIRRKKHLYEK